MHTKTLTRMGLLLAVLIGLAFAPPITVGFLGVPIVLQNMGVMLVAVAMEGLVATADSIKQDKLALIAATTGDTGQCHEGVHQDDSRQYTRTWFSWSNMTFCQLALDVIQWQKREVKP